MTGALSRSHAEDFLYLDAALLESWQLDEWHALFLPDGRYEVPALDDPDGDPTSSQFFIADDPELLAARITRLKSKNAHAENPASMTHRLVSNVRVSDADVDGVHLVTATFIIHRLRDGTIESFPGWYRHRVRVTDDGPRFLVRRAVVASERLRQGRLSFVL